MKTADYFFDLPEELIARYPPPERGDSRLMLLKRGDGTRKHSMVRNLPEILNGPDFRSPDGEAPLLVFNNSRVRKARLKALPMAAKPGSSIISSSVYGGPAGEAEFLLLNRTDSLTWLTLVNRAKRRRPGCRYRFEGGIEGEVVKAPPETDGEDGGTRYIRFNTPIDDDWLDIHGHMPLPPYIKRDDESSDSDRYQTIYADNLAGAALGPGASTAAPTAGLHFTDSLFKAFDAAGIEKVFITLHVGLGTFLPVRTERLEDHIMHEELYSISGDAAMRINTAKAAGRKIIAIGTTAVRTLESASCEKTENTVPGKKMYVNAGEGRTRIFIYPGYRFNITDALFTNFHTPGSTLLMLVSAFAGEKTPDSGRLLILDSYTEAIAENYRFFSYGDAMLIM